jgi:hypothetical protein
MMLKLRPHRVKRGADRHLNARTGAFVAHTAAPKLRFLRRKL